MAEGEWYKISYAVRADGTQPAREIMDFLSTGTWVDAEQKGISPDDQVTAYSRLLKVMEHYAEYGEGPTEKSMNALESGFFEFKALAARICFYDTRGDGTHDEKRKIIYPDDAPNCYSPTWQIPDLDEEIRLCNGWPKPYDQRLTRPADIANARLIRKEDLEYDK